MSRSMKVQELRGSGELEVYELSGAYVVNAGDGVETGSIVVSLESMRRIVDAFPEFVRPTTPEEKP